MGTDEISEINKDLQALASPKRAEASKWFFKTGPGQYGEGDQFLGVKVPDVRKVARKHRDFNFRDLQKLLNSPIHEHRQAALFILVDQFRRGGDQTKKAVFDFYKSNLAAVDNWDLVDGSAHYIVGEYLRDKDKSWLYELARSNNIWQRRISVISTFAYIKDNEFDDALAIAGILVNDDHDLIQKAVGWMLREIGNRDQDIEEEFLKQHYRNMPRTMLRYAIEKFEEPLRKLYLSGEI